MRDVYLVQRQHTAGAYQTIQTYFRKQDARDYLAAQAAMNPDYPYDGGDTYAYGPSKHNKTRFRIVEQQDEKRVIKLPGLKRMNI